MTDKPLGRFCWYELMSKDPAAAKPFYTQLLGWTSQPFEGADTPYDLWVNGEAPFGGLMQLPEEAQAQGAPSHWLAYVSTPDVDATVSTAKDLGGSVMVAPMDIGDIGRIAVLRDPLGATFAVYRSAADMPDEYSTEQPGDITWHELMTTDYEKAFDFYAALFDWQVMQDMDMGPHGVYRIYGRKGKQLGGMFNKPPEAPVAAWLLYVQVADIDNAVEKVKALGGSVLNGPMEVPGGGWIAQCMDPQGGAFAVHAKAEAEVDS